MRSKLSNRVNNSLDRHERFAALSLAKQLELLRLDASKDTVKGKVSTKQCKSIETWGDAS